MATSDFGHTDKSWHQAWMEEEHANHFEHWNRYSAKELVQTCDQFGEFQLFRTLVGRSDCETLLDVGCAAGRFYRFFRTVWPALQYTGVDISPVAVDRASKLHPSGDFRVFDGNTKSLDDCQSDIVFCRDVVHHQVNPQQFLADLFNITNRYLILRLRTREKGPTIFDLSQSCQYWNGNWVPFIVFNTVELIDLIRSFQPSPTSITLMRVPKILGNMNNRFLPKELNSSQAGGAEAMLLVEKAIGKGDGDTVVVYSDQSPLVGRRGHWGLRLKRLAKKLGA